MFWPAGGGPELFPRAKFSGVKRPAIAKLDHFQSFVDACLGGAETQCKFAKTGPMTEVVLLGTVALRVPGADYRMGRGQHEDSQQRGGRQAAAAELPGGVVIRSRKSNRRGV